MTLADSLTISPIGFTAHFDDSLKGFEQYKFTPRGFDPSGKYTWHPTINLIYKTKYMQYGAFYLRDTYDQNSFGFTIGPKYDLNKYFSLGVLSGLYFRHDGPTNCVNNKCISLTHGQFTLTKIGSYGLVPLIGLTGSFTVPINDKIGIEINNALTPKLLHTVIGLKFSF